MSDMAKTLYRPSYTVPRLYRRLCSSPSEIAVTIISIDHSSLYNPLEHSHQPSSDSELVKHLKGIIKGVGGVRPVVVKALGACRPLSKTITQGDNRDLESESPDGT
ncbi:hypothetical protein Fmac_008591 [Flemingia macrophylla]|uniref:Uncharacterized protein n=1 Tax=Flemingia macrophylla TaxID=520843 RepID=A0ABD1MYC8_9FABA